METKIYMCWSKDIFLMSCMLLFFSWKDNESREVGVKCTHGLLRKDLGKSTILMRIHCLRSLLRKMQVSFSSSSYQACAAIASSRHCPGEY